MKRSVLSLGLLAVAGMLLVGSPAHAQDRWRTNWSPFAANAWLGIGYDYVNDNGGTFTGSNNIGINVGGDIGLRFTPYFGIVALAEYSPIFGGVGTAGVFNAGAGLRFQPAYSAEFLVAATYSQISYGNGFGEGGWGVRAMGFAPLGIGFGPYLSLGYNNFGAGDITMFTVNGGISYSF